MSAAQHTDVIIVGQGLAGSLLAWELNQRRLKVLVVDDGHRSSSTRMAAGLLNPVFGLKLVKVRQADRFLSTARRSYGALEQAWGERFYYDKPMLRVFMAQRQRQAWRERLQDPLYADYLGPLQEPGAMPFDLDDRYGSGLQRHTGYLDTRALLAAAKRWLCATGAYREAAFDWSSIRLTEGQVHWQDWSAGCVISCEGYRGKDHPWFPWLPFQPSKGQILTLQSDAVIPDYIINKGKWLLPVGEGKARFGATYERGGVEGGHSDTARTELLQAAEQLMLGRVPWQVVAREAGVRPGIRDRMPVVGLHPQHPQLGMFNGFGSKGVMMAPYYAACFADALQRQAPLPSEVDLYRWWNPHG